MSDPYESDRDMCDRLQKRNDELEARVRVLEDLNATLSAGQCCVPPFITGDDYGNAVCPLKARAALDGKEDSGE